MQRLKAELRNRTGRHGVLGPPAGPRPGPLPAFPGRSLRSWALWPPRPRTAAPADSSAAASPSRGPAPPGTAGCWGSQGCRGACAPTFPTCIGHRRLRNKLPKTRTKRRFRCHPLQQRFWLRAPREVVVESLSVAVARSRGLLILGNGASPSHPAGSAEGPLRDTETAREGRAMPLTPILGDRTEALL